MQISQNFNKFYHGVIVKQLKQAPELYAEDLHFRFRPRQVRIKSFYQLLKALDLQFPNDGERKKSLTKVDNKELLAHIEWCFKLATDSHYPLPYIEEEWQRLIESAR
jgi:hypothetical protein